MAGCNITCPKPPVWLSPSFVPHPKMQASVLKCTLGRCISLAAPGMEFKNQHSCAVTNLFSDNKILTFNVKFFLFHRPVMHFATGDCLENWNNRLQ